MHKNLDMWVLIDIAAQYSSENLEPLAGQQFCNSDFDYVVRLVMDYIPEKHHEAFLDDVTAPPFKP